MEGEGVSIETGPEEVRGTRAKARESVRRCGVEHQRGEKMFGRKTLEEKISTIIREEFAEIIADLEGDHREFRRRLELKEETRSAFEDAQDEARKLRSGRISLKKRFWEAYYEKDEADLSEV